MHPVLLTKACAVHAVHAVQLDVADDDLYASGNGGGAVRPTPLGRVASFYYLKHVTAGLLAEQFRGQQLDHAQVGGGAGPGFKQPPSA